MRSLIIAIGLLFATEAFAGFQAFQQSYSGPTATVKDLKLFTGLQCDAGITCTPKLNGKLEIQVGSASSTLKNYSFMWRPNTLTSGTSTTPAATSVYLTQILIGGNASLTGVKVLNGATVGTNKYVVALFDSAGVKVANSALAGVTTAGANVYQALPFTAAATVKGPGVYWIGLYVNGTTDRFQSIPAVGEIGGYAGSVGAQTFGTVATITPPTSFTADLGPIAFTY